LGLLGPLVWALVLGVAARAVVPGTGRPGVAPGVAFAARTLLRLGIVLLGVRLDARALVELGPWVLVGSALGAVVAFLDDRGGRPRVARAARPAAARGHRHRHLRRLRDRGGAAAGARGHRRAAGRRRARLGRLRRDRRHRSDQPAGHGGRAGVRGLGRLAALPAALGAALAGATLQEVGQAVAAGTAVGGEQAELALLVKLSRVVWLAPALLALGWWGRAEAAPRGPAPARGRRPPPDHAPRPRLRDRLRDVLGVLTSVGVVPGALVPAIATAGTLLTAAAMAAIGLGVDGRALGRAGRQALALGAVGFARSSSRWCLWYLWLLR
jgi:uncharacterized membrane protein YadS